jgi:hypothetical protein
LGFRTWGVTEFNTPRRSWDRDEHGRQRWLEAFARYSAGQRSTARRLGAPKLMLLWEGDGTNWDQRFVTKNTRQWWASVISRNLVAA